MEKAKVVEEDSKGNKVVEGEEVEKEEEAVAVAVEMVDGDEGEDDTKIMHITTSIK